MIKLFSEEVAQTSTNLDRNTLYVESFEEVFFGVYEFKINNETVIAEKVGEDVNGPVVTVPVEANGNKKVEAPFVLRKGKQQVFYNGPKQFMIEKVALPEAPKVSKTNTIYVESFEEIYFGMYEFELNGKKVIAEKVDDHNGNPVVEVPVGDIKTKVILQTADTNIETLTESLIEVAPKETIVEKADKLKAEVKQEVLKVVKSDSKAALAKFREETQQLVDEVTRTKDELFLTFMEGSDSYHKKESRALSNHRKQESKELREFVDNYVKNIREENAGLADTLTESLKDGLDREYGVFQSRLIETQQELKARRIENKKISSHINLLESKQKEINAEFEKSKYISSQVKALEAAQLEINAEFETNKKQLVEATTASNKAVSDAIESSDKNVNKALSRLGTFKKALVENQQELKAIEETLLWSINKAEDRIKSYYQDRLQTVEDTIVNDIRKEEIIEAVKASKTMILAELNEQNGIKEQFKQLAKEARSGEYDPISGKRFTENLKRDLNRRFADEMSNIKRMIELGGGGGGIGDAPNDGEQYARVNGRWVLGGTGSDVSALTGTWQDTYTTVQTYSADWEDTNTTVQTYSASWAGGGEVGPGTINTFSIFTATTAIGDSILTQNADGLGISIGGSTTVNGNLSVLGDFTYVDSTVSVTSALSVINNGTSPALYAEQSGAGEPIAKFVDSEGGSVTIGDGGALAANTLSATGRVDATNISTLENKVEGLYSYLINNFDTNQITTATDLSDFVNNFPKTGLTPGDVITLSAINTAYILGDNDGSANSDWLEVNLKPNFLFYRGGITDYTVIDTIPLSAAKSSKYIIQVEDTSDGALFYGEINVVSDGTIAVATEYALNHTTVFPFVEFGAEVINNRVSLSAMALEGKDMANFTFKGNRSNLFG